MLGFVVVSLCLSVGNVMCSDCSLTVYFSVVAPETVAAILPTNGPVSGSTLVTVTGTKFRSEYTPVCRFGTVGTVQATYHSGSLFVCLSPAASGAAAIALEVSNNNQDFSSSGVVFTYQCMLSAVLVIAVLF